MTLILKALKITGIEVNNCRAEPFSSFIDFKDKMMSLFAPDESPGLGALADRGEGAHCEHVEVDGSVRSGLQQQPLQQQLARQELALLACRIVRLPFL